MTIAALSCLIAVFLAQAPAPLPDAAARLAIMQRSVADNKIRSDNGADTAFRLRPDPVLRFNNPVGASADGAIFFWLGKDDRPEAAVQVFLHRAGPNWVQDFTSLCPAPFVAEAPDGSPWRPARGGVAFQPVPDAPAPADTPDLRSRQLHALAAEFTAEDRFQNKSWQTLRLLSKPLARYGRPGSDVRDGGLYSFALGTDPAAYLMLEVRPGASGAEWQFAFARMSTYALKGYHKGREVWDVPMKGPRDRGPRETFHTRYFDPQS